MDLELGTQPIKNPWSKAWKQLNKSERKRLLLLTCKQRKFLCATAILITLPMFSPYIMFLPFAALPLILILCSLENQLNKNILSTYPHLIDRAELDKWELLCQLRAATTKRKWSQQPDYANDSFYDTSAINMAGSLAYLRTHPIKIY